jgi:hypothetical protein
MRPSAGVTSDMPVEQNAGAKEKQICRITREGLALSAEVGSAG